MVEVDTGTDPETDTEDYWFPGLPDTLEDTGFEGFKTCGCAVGAGSGPSGAIIGLGALGLWLRRRRG